MSYGRLLFCARWHKTAFKGYIWYITWVWHISRRIKGLGCFLIKEPSFSLSWKSFDIISFFFFGLLRNEFVRLFGNAPAKVAEVGNVCSLLNISSKKVKVNVAPERVAKLRDFLTHANTYKLRALIILSNFILNGCISYLSWFPEKIYCLEY